MNCPPVGVLWRDTCYRMDYVNQDIRNVCAFLGEYFGNLNDLRDSPACKIKCKQTMERYIGMKETGFRYGTLRDVKDLEEIIRTDLLEPNTAFLSPEDHFESDWKTFTKMMRQTGRRFAHAKKMDGIKVTYGFHMSSGLNPYIDIIKLRTEMLIESGIYGLWKKW